MSKEYNEALDCQEGISVGNWAWGSVVIKPDPAAVTSVTVSGLNLQGTGDVCFQASAKSAYPWIAMGETGVAPPDGASSFEEDPSQFRIFIYRTTGAATRIHWMAWREVN